MNRYWSTDFVGTIYVASNISNYIKTISPVRMINIVNAYIL